MYVVCEPADGESMISGDPLCAPDESVPRVARFVLSWPQVTGLLSAHRVREQDARASIEARGERVESVDLGLIECDSDEARGRIIEEYAWRMQTARSLGAGRVGLSGGAAAARNFGDDVVVLRALGEPARGLGVRLCIRNRFDSSVEQLDDLHVLFRDTQVPALGLDLDVEAFQRAAVNPSDAVLSFSGRIAQVRLADLRGRRRVALGEGDVSVAAVIRSLAQEHYDGPLVLRQERGAGARERLASDLRYVLRLGAQL